VYSTTALHYIHSVLKIKQNSTNQDGAHLRYQETRRLEIHKMSAPNPGVMLQPKRPRVYIFGDTSSSLPFIAREATWQSWVTTKTLRQKLSQS